MSADRRNDTHREWPLALVVFWGRDGAYTVFVPCLKQGGLELWLRFLNVTGISTDFFLKHSFGPQLVFTLSTTMCKSSCLYHCGMQGAFRLPPENTESMAKCKNQNHVPGCSQGKPSKNSFCHHGMLGLTGKDLGWVVKPESAFHAKPSEGLGLVKALKSIRPT